MGKESGSTTTFQIAILGQGWVLGGRFQTPKWPKIKFRPQKYRKNHDAKKHVFEALTRFYAEIWAF